MGRGERCDPLPAEEAGGYSVEPGKHSRFPALLQPSCLQVVTDLRCAKSCTKSADGSSESALPVDPHHVTNDKFPRVGTEACIDGEWDEWGPYGSCQAEHRLQVQSSAKNGAVPVPSAASLKLRTVTVHFETPQRRRPEL